ncbi:MAG: ATP-binding protein, partial [Erysipelotrichia bacterium]|nr:ATP-binding protein [Erysipelotrichia bacterium]
MVKNAMEASQHGETVTIWARQNGELVEFRVNNPGVIRDDVKMQLFNRSFSTKGEGRGIGTYSMRLLSEKFLHGHVSFASTPDDGTTFIASYPLALA